jgi:hypothetical protein
MAIDEKFIKNSLSNIKCELCSQRYQPADMCILGHQENWWFLSLYCPSCRRGRLAVVIVARDETSKVVTELTEKERDEPPAPVDTDDLLDMHIFLKDFSGNFCSLFPGN